MLVFSYDGANSGVLGPEPVHRVDELIRLWLATFTVNGLWALFQAFLGVVFPRTRYHLSPLLPVFDFRPQVPDYPQAWTLDEIAHQHFLVCTWLSFWCLEELGPANWPVRVYWLRRESESTMPSVFNELLD
jgi:hypothetical protein